MWLSSFFVIALLNDNNVHSLLHQRRIFKWNVNFFSNSTFFTQKSHYYCEFIQHFTFLCDSCIYVNFTRITTVFRSVDLTASNLFTFAKQFSAHALFLFVLSIISVYLCVSLNAICCLSTDAYWISSLQLFIRAHFPFSFAHIRFVVFFNIFNFVWIVPFDAISSDVLLFFL